MNTGVIYYIASRFWGGGEEYVLNLSRTLRDRGHNVAFVLQSGSDTVVKERFAEIGDTLELDIKSKNGKFSYLSALRLCRFAQAHNAKVLHVNAMKDYFVAVLAKIFSCARLKVVATNHLVERAKSKPSWRWAYSHIDALINVSECARKEFLLSSKIESSFKRIYVIKNSVPYRDSRVPRDSSQVIVLYHGRIHKEKGILDLLPHWKEVNAQLLIAGSGEHIPDTPNVVALGFRTDIHNILNECDICVCPSLVRESGGPISLIEAMAAGCPVVASCNGSQPEYMRDGIDGTLCPAGDWDAFVRALNHLIDNKSLRMEMGCNARAHYESDFSFDKFIETIELVYEEIN